MSKKRKRMRSDPPKSTASTCTDSSGSIGPPKHDKKQKKKKKKKKKKNDRPTTPICVAHQSIVEKIQTQLPSEGTDVLTDFPKNEIANSLPSVPFFKGKKKIVVISDALSSHAAVTAIRDELEQISSCSRSDSQNNLQYLGFDTETRPKFSKGGNPHPIALVQLATASTAYLFRIYFEGMEDHPSSVGGAMTDSLLDILSDKTVIKVGVGVYNDILGLKGFHGNDCCGDGTSFLDLTKLVKIRWPMIKRAGLRNLTATVLGWNLSKAQQMKNWERIKLTVDMEKYAAADAFVALDLLWAMIGGDAKA